MECRINRCEKTPGTARKSFENGGTNHNIRRFYMDIFTVPE
jgi:hypothetical protein